MCDSFESIEDQVYELGNSTDVSFPVRNLQEKRNLILN